MIFPRQRQPPARTAATTAKKLGEAPRRLRRRCVVPQRTSPSRGGAHQVREVVSTAVSPLLFPRRSWPRVRKGPVADIKYARAPVCHCCLGYFSGGSDRVGGENTNSKQTGPGATCGRNVDSGAAALFLGGRRLAGGTKPTPAHQVREVASFAVLPPLFSRRS